MKARAFLERLLPWAWGLFLILSWVLPLAGITTVASFGGIMALSAALLMTASAVGTAALVASAVGVLALYGLIFVSIVRRDRWNVVFLTVVMTVDVAALVIATAISWWYLLAVCLDLVLMLGMLLSVFRKASAK